MSACRAAFLALVLVAGCQSVPPDPPPVPPPIASPEPLVTAVMAAAVTGIPLAETPPPPPPARVAAPVPAVAPVAATSGVGPPQQGAVDLAGRPFFCAPLQPLPRPPPYCTRSIGAVDCWVQPPLTLPPRRGIADGRDALTPAQAAQRQQCWPGFL